MTTTLTRLIDRIAARRAARPQRRPYTRSTPLPDADQVSEPPATGDAVLRRRLLSPAVQSTVYGVPVSQFSATGYAPWGDKADIGRAENGIISVPIN